MWWELVHADLITLLLAGPPTAMALLAWRQSKHNGRQMDTGNGHSLAEYVLKLHDKLDDHADRDRQAFAKLGVDYDE